MDQLIQHIQNELTSKLAHQISWDLKYIFYINILTRLKMYALKNYENNLSIINNNGNNDKNNYLMITKLF